MTQVIRESVWIEAPNRFEIQGKNECTGFAVAYVLRHFEIEVTGKEIYDAVRFKLPSGRVLPRGPINELRRHGIHAQVYTGTLNTLKARLSMGNPIIVVTGDGLKWMHYFVLVGYDEPTKELHFYDPEIAEDGNGKDPRKSHIGRRTVLEIVEHSHSGLPKYLHSMYTIRRQTQ